MKISRSGLCGSWKSRCRALHWLLATAAAHSVRSAALRAGGDERRGYLPAARHLSELRSGAPEAAPGLVRSLGPDASRWGYSGRPAGTRPPLQAQLSANVCFEGCYLLCAKLLSKYSLWVQSARETPGSLGALLREEAL